jgi:hypothetical protein
MERSPPSSGGPEVEPRRPPCTARFEQGDPDIARIRTGAGKGPRTTRADARADGRGPGGESTTDGGAVKEVRGRHFWGAARAVRFTPSPYSPMTRRISSNCSRVISPRAKRAFRISTAPPPVPGLVA